MPERVVQTNTWNMFDDEYFITTDERVVRGPQKSVKVESHPGNLLSASIQGYLYEIEGSRFSEVVKKDLTLSSYLSNLDSKHRHNKGHL